MTSDNSAALACFRKLGRLSRLDANDLAAIETLPFIPSAARAGEHLIREGDCLANGAMLLSGYACRHKTTGDGGRQIVSLHVPGDLLGLHHLVLDRADHNLQMITDVTYASIPLAALRKVMQARPAIAEAVWRDTLIDASISREWVLNVGRRDARSRIAHMLCEFGTRRQQAGLGSPDQFELPMTQEQIADATGLTSVHVNRMLSALCAEGVIGRGVRRFKILDWRQLQKVAGFDPGYLHLAD